MSRKTFIRCDRSNCALNDVSLHENRPGWLKCECGEEWHGSERDFLAEVANVLGEATGIIEPHAQDMSAWRARLTDASRLLAQKHIDAMKYQQGFRNANRPVPNVDLATMQPDVGVRKRGHK